MSEKEKIVLTGIGHFLPENEIDNSFFETLGIGSSSDWIKEKTGILSRCSVLSREQICMLLENRLTIKELFETQEISSIADMSEIPWLIAKKRSCLSHNKVDYLICGTSIPDFAIPANASTVAERNHINSICFDAQSACSSFVTNAQIAFSLLKNSHQSSCAIFNIERYSTRLDYKDRSSCVLFGDGATCAIFEKGKNLSGFEVLDIRLFSDPTGCYQVKIPIFGSFYQNGSAVQKFAISKTCAATREILEAHNLAPQDISYFIGHQANLRMLCSAVEKLGLKPEQHLFNVDRYGNQGAAGAPSVLSENWDKFKKGQLIIITVVGSGLTWGSLLLKKI